MIIGEWTVLCSECVSQDSYDNPSSFSCENSEAEGDSALPVPSMPTHTVVMPRCACASEVYGSVFVCLCVCVDCYRCRINEVQVRVSIGF